MVLNVLKHPRSEQIKFEIYEHILIFTIKKIINDETMISGEFQFKDPSSYFRNQPESVGVNSFYPPPLSLTYPCSPFYTLTKMTLDKN